MINNSYVSLEDNTYEKGEIIDKAIKKLKVIEVEVWGLGNETIYTTQKELKAKYYEYIYV